MKKYYYLLIFLFAAFAGKSQNVPNGDFENWNNFIGYSTPVSWNTTDSIASTQNSQRSVLQDTVAADVWSGHSSMKMQSWTYDLAFTEPGAASTGTLNFSTFSFEGGTPDTIRHQTLTGWYKYTPAGGDSASVTVTLTKWNGSSRNIIATGAWSQKGTVSSYALFSITLNYALSANPDTALIVILGAPFGFNSAHTGTTLIIDDLNFSGVVSGIDELSANDFSVSSYPNPASGFLNIELKGTVPAKKSISILDINGKLLQSAPMTGNKQQTDIRSLSNGNYLYELIDEKGTKLYSGKFSINH